MTRTSRALTAVLASAALALTGCSGSEGSGSSDGGSGDSGASANDFTAAGVSFEAPDGWEELDAEDADVSGEGTADVAEGLGMTPEQLQATIQQVDLFVVDGDGPQSGFLSNINVLEQQGELPADKLIEQQFSQMGATVNGVSHPDAGIDEVTAVDYSLEVPPNTVEGISYLVPLGDQVVTITVSTPDRAQSTEIGEAVLASLTEAG